MQASSPYLLRGPLPRPVGGHVGVVLVRLGAGGSLDLDQVEDLEAVRAQQADPVAVREVVLDAAVRPRKRCIPNCGRCSVSSPAASSSRRAEDDERRVAEKDELAAGPQEPRRLGDPLVRVGPDRGAVLRDGEVERGVGERDVLRRTPRRTRARGRTSRCSDVRSRAAPASDRRRRRARRRPSSATRRSTRCRSRARRRPCRSTSGSACSSLSGTCQMPQLISSRAHACSARASVYSAFARVQASTVGSVTEPERDLALRRLRRVGAVHEVVGHRGGEVAADRPRRGVRGIGRADRRPHRRDRAFALDDERPRRARGDELDELAEERLLAVLGVVLLPQLAAGGDELRLRGSRSRVPRSARGSRRRADAARRRA